MVAAGEQWTTDKRNRFLAELAIRANVRAAAGAVGMSEASVYQLRSRSAAFRDGWEAALQETYARLEVELLDRATNGTEKPVFYAGKQIGSVIEYPDRLALSLMDQRRAQRGAGKSGKDPDAGRARLAAKLSQMNVRMGGDG